MAPGFELDPETLETLGPTVLGLPDGDAGPKAHARRIPASGDWIFASTRLGPKGMLIDLVRRRADGSTVATPTVSAPRMTYVHDFGATDRSAVFILHPAQVHALRYLAGLASFTECLEWRPALGNLVLLVDLASGEAQSFEAPACWCWHVANAYEVGGDVVLDLVGYDDPGHFLGPDAQLAAVMRGAAGVHGAPGRLRRYVLHRKAGRLAETVLPTGNYEFPSIDNRASGDAHGRVYVTSGSQPGVSHSGIAALDTRTGVLDAFDFGAHANAGEPVFAADPDGAKDAGWVITQVLDAERSETMFAIFAAGRIAAGPIATIGLGETLPISFHGDWVASGR